MCIGIIAIGHITYKIMTHRISNSANAITSIYPSINNIHCVANWNCLRNLHLNSYKKIYAALQLIFISEQKWMHCIYCLYLWASNSLNLFKRCTMIYYSHSMRSTINKEEASHRSGNRNYELPRSSRLLYAAQYR